MEIERLIPLNREHVTFFKVEGYKSKFIELFMESDASIEDRELKLNISTIEYMEDGGDMPIFKRSPSRDMRYAILILNQIKCCIYPPILKLILQEYSDSRVFLIIENESGEEAKKRVRFLKNYSRLNRNILDIYNTTGRGESIAIKRDIYRRLEDGVEANSLWKREWISIRDEVERRGSIDRGEFQSIADSYGISADVAEYIFKYLQRVGYFYQ